MSSLMKIPDQDFGVIINDFILKDIYSKEESDLLCNLLHKEKLLIFRNLKIDYHQFECFARQFGELEVAHPAQFQIKDHPYLRIQSNVVNESEIDYVGTFWHSDGSWQKLPSKATLLSCLQAVKVGGETLFADMSAAYDALSSTIKEKLENLTGYYPSRDIYLQEMQELGVKLDVEEEERLCNVNHPIVKEHPITKKKALFLNQELLKNIVELTEEKSNELLDYLYQFSTQKIFIYKHAWDENDLLVWDNSLLIHKGLRPDSRYPKTTIRITIKGIE